MSQRLQISSGRGGHDERRWLSLLVEAMQDAAEPGQRAAPCDSRTLAALRSQLALPAQLRFASTFSLRN
jgi:hypothetical protein